MYIIVHRARYGAGRRVNGDVRTGASGLAIRAAVGCARDIKQGHDLCLAFLSFALWLEFVFEEAQLPLDLPACSDRWISRRSSSHSKSRAGTGHCCGWLPVEDRPEPGHAKWKRWSQCCRYMSSFVVPLSSTKSDFHRETSASRSAHEALNRVHADAERTGRWYIVRDGDGARDSHRSDASVAA